MDRFIKSVPIIITLIFIAILTSSAEGTYSNITIAALCALVIFMFTSGVYIIRIHQKKTMMVAKSYFFVMLGAGLLTFVVLYAGLEYFYDWY